MREISQVLFCLFVFLSAIILLSNTLWKEFYSSCQSSVDTAIVIDVANLVLGFRKPRLSVSSLNSFLDICYLGRESITLNSWDIRMKYESQSECYMSVIVASDQRFWQVRFSWGILNIPQHYIGLIYRQCTFDRGFWFPDESVNLSIIWEIYIWLFDSLRKVIETFQRFSQAGNRIM